MTPTTTFKHRLRLLAVVASALFALMATCSLALAQAPMAFGKGDATIGAAMHEKDCVACHVRRVGGDGTRMYTRPDRRVNTPAQLKTQIAFCNSQLGTGYFPDEEDHVAAYLNLRHYKLKD